LIKFITETGPESVTDWLIFTKGKICNFLMRELLSEVGYKSVLERSPEIAKVLGVEGGT